jgi:hypothetical protein
MQNAAIGRDIQTRFLLNHRSFLGTPVWSKPSGIDMGQTLAEKNHTEQSTGALATIVAATYSLELAL